MNKRIKLLAEQAWVYQVRVFNEPDGSRTYSEKEKVFDQEKFAELIVRECAQFVEDKFDFCGDEIIIAEEVRKQFGVEE